MAERHELTTRTEMDDSFKERSVDEIRQDIAARRETITETVDKLSEQVQRKLDWREYVADHPFAALGLAAGTGVVLAGLFKPRSSPAERIMCALSDSVEDITGRVRDQLDFLPEKRPKTKGALMVAATSIITKALADYLGNRLNGVGDSQHNRNQPDGVQHQSEQGYSRGTSA